MTTEGYKLIWHDAMDGSITGKETTPPLIQAKNA